MERVKGRNLIDGQRVYVYLNIRTKAFSIVSLEGETKGLVVASAKQLSLKGDCEFRVGKKGRERVLSEGVKNVHAGVFGEIDLSSQVQKGNVEVTYNPKKYDSFVECLDGAPVHRAKEVYFENTRVYI